MPEQTLTVDSGRIHAEHIGTGADSAVLLLHAGVADRRVWNHVVGPLHEAGHHVIRYDVRGYGRSEPATEPHSLVADALLVLDAAGVESAHFVGLSQGAATSVDTALAHPRRVRSLTLVAPGLSGYEWPRLPGFAERMAAAEAGDTHGYALAIAHLWAPLSFEDGRTDCDEAARIILDQAEQFMRDEQEIEEPSAIPRLGEINVPTTVVLGDRDVDAITDIGNLLAGGIPDARRHVLDNADHMLPLRTPGRLVDLILTTIRT